MTAEEVISRALSFVGTKEDPPHSNSGGFIDMWLRSLARDPGEPWCAAFACNMLAGVPDFIWSASAIRLWEKNRPLWVPRGQPPLPGDIVIWTHGHGRGHVGIVTEVGADQFTVVAGNTTNGLNYCDRSLNRDKSREGDQVGVNVYPSDDVSRIGFLRPKYEATSRAG